jgi:DNA-binding transcriptional LysR family regulator
MDRLSVMRSFVAVTRSQNFSRAARTLGISGSLISRHVAELERDLGVRLVNRTARAVSLTQAGHRYADFAARIINEIDREENILRSQRNKAEGPLAIISPKWIGNSDVADAIISFSMRYPKIHIRFEVGGMSERFYDFLDQGFDVAFHTRQVRDSNLLLKKITDLKFALCAAPLYLGRAGKPERITDISDHDCLINTNDPIWHLRNDGQDVHVKICEPVYASNSYFTLRKAALAGRGIALLPVRLVAADLADARLAGVMPGSGVPDRPLYALHSPGSETPARVQLFIDHVSDWFRRHAVDQPVPAEAGVAAPDRRRLTHDNRAQVPG